LRIIILHNHYRQAGGEDAVVTAERCLLQQNGHCVRSLEVNNDGIAARNMPALAVSAIYSRSSRRFLEREIGDFRPDLVHVHNFFPRLSPSIYFGCEKVGIPVVQTLHNYRLICPGALLFREDRVCEECLGKAVPWPAVLHGCYRNSRIGTAVVATMCSVHSLLNTWSDKVSAYVALTRFAREKFVTGGLPAEKVLVKPNFVQSDAGPGTDRGRYALFVGRLAPEKGIRTLLKAWSRIARHLALRVLGDGPLRAEVTAAEIQGVEYLGWRAGPEVRDLMRGAKFLVFPSEWYEGFPMVLVEAFAAGLPVIASDLGGMHEIVSHRETGLLFRTGDADDLVTRVHELLDNPALLRAIQVACRAEYEAKYTPERNYQLLLEIYRRAGVTCAG
jgi:glycosyltransferase involved in cell wall biosynthesis